MKKYLVVALLLFPFCLVGGQNLRNVMGKVVDENGAPMTDVTITSEDGSISSKSDQAGSFSIRVPYACRSIKASFENYVPVTAEIDGSVLIIRMKYDAAGVQARKDAQLKAQQDSVKAAEAAEKTAAAAAATALKAEQLAREKAAKEAEAQAKADAMAREKAAEAAKREAEAKERADAISARRTETQRKDNLYNEKYKNKGLSHSFDFSYMYELYSGTCTYKYSGVRKYGNLSPFQFTYTLSYKFNRWCSLGIGTGVLYNAKSITIENDSFYFYPDFKEKRLDIPVFLNFKTYFFRTGVRPFISLDGGYYCLAGKILWDAGIGCEFRLGRSSAIQVQAMVASVPWPDFSLNTAAYSSIVSPGVKVGFSY